MNRFTFLAAWAALISILTITGCQKEPYIPEFQGPPPVCLLSGYSCTVSNNGVESFNGSVNYEYLEEEFFLSYSESNDNCSFEFEDDDFYLSYSWDATDYRFYFYGDNWPQSVSYLLGSYNEVDVEATYGSNYRLTELEQTTENFLNPNSDRIRRIDETIYSNNNLVSYRYREWLANSPYTLLLTENYEISYDLDYEYDKKAFLNEKLYSILPRPLLGTDYSFGEIFNPQYFSKNLVLEKRNTTSNTSIFANAYIFDADTNIIRLTQTYADGVGFDPATITWTYQYRCE